MSCSSHECSIKYTHFFWTITILLMLLFIIDRFTINIWPFWFTHQVNLNEDNWTEIVFFVIGCASGRILIISSSFIWLLQARCFWNWCFEHKPKWLIIEDIMQENNNIHYVMGWLCIGIPVILHPWLVFLPLIQQYDFNLFSTWWRPIDPSTNFYVENVHHHDINISIQDLYALLITTFIFIIIFPLSMYSRFKHKHWTISHYLHLFGALIYGIELIRTPFTVHCWYLSTPFIFMYIVDRIYGIYKYRKCTNTTIVGRYKFDEDYILLLLHIPNIYQRRNSEKHRTYRQIGDVMYLNTKHLESCKGWKPSHPFTTFYNHGNNINMIEFTRSLRTTLGDESHKFPVLTLKDQRSVAYTELDEEEQYQLDRIESQSATIERWKWKMNKLKANRKENSQSLSIKRLEMQQKQIEISDSMDAKRMRYRNKRKQHQPLQQEMDDGDEEDNKHDVDEEEIEWNVGVVIQVHQREDDYGFTQFLKNCDLEDKRNKLVTYGPYRSSFANIIRELIEYKLDQIVNHNEFGQGSIVLIATGAGVSYIIEFVLWLRYRFESDDQYLLMNEIRIHFSCRSIRLFQWVTDFLCRKKYEMLSIYAHFTSHDNFSDYDGNDGVNDKDQAEMDRLNESQRNGDRIKRKKKKKKKKRSHAKIGRASFQDVLNNSPKHSTVFFCGSPRIQQMIKTICKELGFQFYEGHTF